MQKEDLSPPATNQFTLTSRTNRNKLWQDSEITGKFVSPELSFFRERRFKWASIYWPESNEAAHLVKKKRKSEVHEMAAKISKMIDEEEKNEMRIKQIKRTFSIGKSTTNSLRKESHSVLSTKKPFKLSKENEVIVQKLSALQEKKQSTLRDRHGNRCNLFEDPESEAASELTYLGMSTGFKTSRKMKLELPHNYFPGPGTYEIKRYLSELDPKSYEPLSSRREESQHD